MSALYSEAQGELQRDAEGPKRGDVEGLGHPEDGPEGRRRRRRDGRELGEGGVEGADDGEERAVEEGHERADVPIAHVRVAFQPGIVSAS